MKGSVGLLSTAMRTIDFEAIFCPVLNRGLRACWGIMGNQGKQKQDGSRA